MCSEIKIISKTKNGIVFQCKTCLNYQIEFNNLNFNFTEKEYCYFTNYITSIDIGYYKQYFKDDLHRKKIKLPIGHNNLTITINVKELNELKQLFTHNIADDFGLISLDEIQYDLFMN